MTDQMRRLLATLAAAALSGLATPSCGRTPHHEPLGGTSPFHDHFGEAQQANRVAMIAHPEAGKDAPPPEGTDTTSAELELRRYHETHTKDPAPKQLFLIETQ